ncbi:flagellar hook-basal body complex protein FliE [Limimaricola sp. G21655-S1]|uniref:flagellar hook-basal body complex protein FliE n=1 Tax=unclassified Limimaricola TaxID=2626459 RepID=UPI0022AF45F0|nr:flagellar hook-basal body complex protein FliE [Limimaricola sp. G21655-S1]MCZ4261387.1 flagellar hook-basal body complex protein FliE [Limimaricola sp. G21655-S1]
MELGPLVSRHYAASKSATTPEPGGDGATLAAAARDFAATMARGEGAAMAAMQGGGDPHALVQSLAQAELAVETVTTLRNKVVEAYQEILRMPV